MTASSLGRSSTVATTFILIFSFFFSWINLPLSHSQLIHNDAQQQRSSANTADSLSLGPSAKFSPDTKQNNSTLQSFGKNTVLTKQVCLSLAVFLVNVIPIN